jgi:outer membrane protein
MERAMTALRKLARFLLLLLIGGLGIWVLGSDRLAAQTGDGIESSAVAVIDVQRLVLESKTGKQVLERLRDLREQKMAEGETIQQEIRDLQGQLQTGGMSLSEDKVAEMEKQIDDRMIDLRRFSDDADRMLAKEQEEAFAQIEREIMPIISQVGQEQGYTLIFNKFDSGLLYALDQVDITDMILQRYDAGDREDG